MKGTILPNPFTPVPILPVDREALYGGLISAAHPVEYARHQADTLPDTDGSLQMLARHRIQFATPSPSAAGDRLEALKGDDADPFSFHSEGDPDGTTITQHRFYQWGGTIIAIGELNYPNQWDCDAFNAKCAALEAALSTPIVPERSGMRDADDCPQCQRPFPDERAPDFVISCGICGREGELPRNMRELQSTTPDPEIGQVVWCSSEEDGGADVGILVGLGSGKTLWLGELLNAEGGGMGFAIYGPAGKKEVAPLSDWETVRDVIEFHVAPALSATKSEVPADHFPDARNMVLVPCEPTEAMYAAAEKVDFGSEDERAMASNVWNAMLSATPEKPADGEVQS